MHAETEKKNKGSADSGPYSVPDSGSKVKSENNTGSGSTL